MKLFDPFNLSDPIRFLLDCEVIGLDMSLDCEVIGLDMSCDLANLIYRVGL
jgi:hypothetical protein